MDRDKATMGMKEQCHAPRPEGRGVKPLRDQEAWK